MVPCLPQQRELFSLRIPPQETVVNQPRARAVRIPAAQLGHAVVSELLQQTAGVFTSRTTPEPMAVKLRWSCERAQAERYPRRALRAPAHATPPCS